jgi:hypothetical protein
MNEKMMQVMDLYEEVSGKDQILTRFFNLDSEEMLDLKIEVLTRLKNGVPPKDIPEYYSILELYPDDGSMWD